MTSVWCDGKNAKHGSRKPQRLVTATARTGLFYPFEFRRSEALVLRVAAF